MSNLVDVCDDLGISYRQADYWIRKGYLQVRTAGRGSGTRVDLSWSEEAALTAIAQLVKAGLTVEAAVGRVPDLLERGFGPGWTADLRVEIGPPPP